MRIAKVVFAFLLVITASIVALLLLFEYRFELKLWYGTTLDKRVDDYVVMRSKDFTEPGRQSENPHEITVVTMYLRLERFQKGNGNLHFSSDTYKNWMTTWGWLTNRVIAFFDNEEAMSYFRKIRSSQPENRTVLLSVNRTRLPSFRHWEKIRELYKLPSYPKHPPNTVNADYSCTMNAKYDAIQIAINRSLVYTKHLVWLDIGLFRNLLNPKLRPSHDQFTLEVPDGFSPESIAMSEVAPRNHLIKKSPWEFISRNMVWVGGAFVLGTKETLMEFSKSYSSAVDFLIGQNMSSTDQQVIGTMYSPALVDRQKVDIMAYQCDSGQFGLYGSDLQYFSMGYICKEAAEMRKSNNSNNDLYKKCRFSKSLQK